MWYDTLACFSIQSSVTNNINNQMQITFNKVIKCQFSFRNALETICERFSFECKLNLFLCWFHAALGINYIVIWQRHWMQWANDEMNNDGTKNDNKITNYFTQEISRRNTHIFCVALTENNQRKEKLKGATHLRLFPIIIMRQVASVKHCTFCEFLFVIFFYFPFFFLTTIKCISYSVIHGRNISHLSGEKSFRIT